MVCPNCYAKVNPEDEFCGECGHRLKAPAAPQQEPAQQVSYTGEISTPAQAPSQPEYLQPGLDAPRKKSRLWIIVLVIVLICALTAVCLFVFGAEFIYDLFNPQLPAVG